MGTKHLQSVPLLPLPIALKLAIVDNDSYAPPAWKTMHVLLLTSGSSFEDCWFVFFNHESPYNRQLCSIVLTPLCLEDPLSGGAAVLNGPDDPK